MTELANFARVKRGFHRVGLALSIVLGAFALAGGAIFSWDSAGSQREHFLAMRCAIEKLDTKATDTSASPPQITDEHDLDRLALGTVFIDPDGKKRTKLPAVVPIGKLGCGYSFETASREELAASRNNGFNYAVTLASYLGVTALITALVGLRVYYSVAAFSWIVRGFMRG